MNSKPKQILLTNDDGIRSPGLWAAAEALSVLGYVTVVAPREQCSGMGRSLPVSSDGIITSETILVHGKEWTAYAVGGSPAQAVLHGAFEILPEKPDLVVSGINFGENVGIGITASGTVGAALEGASLGIPSIAISLETSEEYYLTYSADINFSTAGHFLRQFAEKMLNGFTLTGDAAVLKVEIPSDATPQTPWRMTRLEREPYFIPRRLERESWDTPGAVPFSAVVKREKLQSDSDVYTLRVMREVSVTPLSLDLTARVNFSAIEKDLKNGYHA